MNAAFRVAICIAVGLLCGCPITMLFDHRRPQGAPNTTIEITPTDDALLFCAVGEGGSDLYLLELANRSVTRIAQTPDYELDPSFSHDGRQIVFAAGVPGDRADHIFTVMRDGSSRQQLTQGNANDLTPRFSPDGSLVVFARNKTYQWGGMAANWGSDSVICTIAADGTGERQITPDGIYAYKPLFSQDGKSILYATEDGLYSVPVDQSSAAVKIGPSVRQASLSPLGQQLVHSAGRFSPDHELFLADLDGNHSVQITPTSSNGCFHPVFANSGDRVYYLVEEWPNGLSGLPKSSIWTVKTDGTGQTQITDLTLFDNPLHWQPQTSP